VHEYTRELVDGRPQYRLSRTGIEFSAYVRENGFNIIAIKSKDQLAYGCNVLNLGNGNIIAVHAETARQIASSPFFSGHIRHIEYSGITSMVFLFFVFLC